jgi:hypothetical protein
MDKDSARKKDVGTAGAESGAQKGSTAAAGDPEQAAQTVNKGSTTDAGAQNRTTDPGNTPPKTLREMFDDGAYAPKIERDERGSRDPLDRLFSEENRMPESRGEPCEIPDLPNIEPQFLNARSLVISGYDPKELCWAGIYLADRENFSFRYMTDWFGVSGLTWVEIVQALKGRDAPTCLIVSYATHDAHRRFAGSSLVFGEAAKRLRATPHGLIVYVHPQAVTAVGSRLWLDNVPLLEIPDRRAEQARAKRVDPIKVVQEIFAPSASTAQELFAAPNRLLIPRALLRLAVLFPNLSTSNFDALLEPMLRGRRVELTPAGKNTAAKEADAWDLWTIGRQTYEQQAGLIRETAGAGMIIRFDSQEAEDTASMWVWRYPEDLLSLFAAASSRRILFGDHFGDEEDELLNSYLRATVNLADRAPGFFGARWPEILFQDFSGWVQDNAHDFETPANDLFALLARLENDKKRGRFWSRFAERMAMLAGPLYRDPSKNIVDQFFGQLARQDLGELVLQILRRISSDIPNENLFEWIERIAKSDNSEVRALAVQEMALQILWYPDAAKTFLPRLRNWLDKPDQEKASPIFKAAVALPAFLFDAAAGKSIDPTQETSPLLASLQSAAEDGETLKDYCNHALAKEEFGRIAGDFLLSEHIAAEEQPSFAVALALYQSALALPDSEHAITIEFLESAFQPLPLRSQNAVRSWWKQFAEQCRMMRTSIPSDSPDRSRHRESLNRRCEIARMLIQH